MISMFKLIFIAVFLIVLLSLGIAMFYLTTDEQDSKRMVSALTLRVVLSFLLVGLLLFGFFSGLIQPNIP